MRNIKQLATDLVRKPPMIFPLIGLFHVLWLVRTTWSASQEPFGIMWVQVAWLAGYTTFWIAMCDLRKWGAWGYILLTALDIALFFTVSGRDARNFYTSDIIFGDVLFCLFVLLYFRRFKNDQKRAEHVT